MKLLINIQNLLFLALCAVGCNSFSKYPIDKNPGIKANLRMVGSWALAEDTDKANYFIVRPYAALSKGSHPDEAAIAHLPENTKNMFRYPDYFYAVTYMNHGGKNPQYEKWGVFPSLIENITFLNIDYRYRDDEGFLLLKINKINSTYDTITASMVADKTMKDLWSPELVRARITMNLNKPSFYDKPLHFYRVNK